MICTVTVFEGFDDKGIYNSRCVGYYANFADADGSIRLNNLEIYGHAYKYAVIEKVEEGFSPLALERWFYEWDGGYRPMGEPEPLKGFANFWIG